MKTIKLKELQEITRHRKYLHQVIQLVGAFGRCYLPEDPMDETSAMEWYEEQHAFESMPVPGREGRFVRVGLNVREFKLYIREGEEMIHSFSMVRRSRNEGLEWMQLVLPELGYNSEEYHLNLPYQIEQYDYAEALEPDQFTLYEICKMFSNAYWVLDHCREMNGVTYEILCWPHHFDMAFLIPLDANESGEYSKSSGIGFLLGDEGVPQPYYYINEYPGLSYEELSKEVLKLGTWNKTGWTGAYLTFQEFDGLSVEEIEVFVAQAKGRILIAIANSK